MPRNRSEKAPLPQVDEYGDKRWHNAAGKLHREDGPAVEWSDGSRHWYLNGKLHREDGPAAEYPNGVRRWYLHGKLQPDAA